MTRYAGWGSLVAGLVLAIGLTGATTASAQSWQSERQGRGAAIATVSVGGASFAVECEAVADGPAVRIVYRPSDITAVTLQSESLTGEGETGDGESSGYLFLNLDSSAVQQFVRRSADGQTLVGTDIGDAVLDMLRHDSQLVITPGLFLEPSFDAFPLRGSSRAIDSALDTCVSAVRPTQPPPSPPPSPSAAETPDLSAQDEIPASEQISESAGPFMATATDYVCARIVPLRVTAPDTNAFMRERTALQAAITDARWKIVGQCQAATQLRVFGMVDETQVYDGVAAEESGWVLVDLVLPGESLPVPAPGDRATAAGETALVEATPPDSGHPEHRPDGAAAPSGAVSPVTIDRLPYGSDIACPAANAVGFAEPSSSYSPYSSNALVYDEADETLLITPDLGATLYDAGAGNDTVYVYDLHAGTAIHGGEGADTIVLCALQDVSLVVTLGTIDTEPDTLVLEPSVFRNVPAGFTREIRVDGFVQPGDRLVLKVPPELGDVEIVDTNFAAPRILAGEVEITLVFPRGSGPDGSFDPAGVLVYRTDTPADAPPEPATGEPELRHDGPASAGVACPQAVDPELYAEPISVDHGMYRYTPEDDEILVTAVTGITTHFAGTGDDVVYVVDGGAGTHVNLDAGADILVFCSTREISMTAAAGDELSSIDSDDDVIIFAPGAFQTIPAGYQRSYMIYSISPINDRIIVQPPPGLEATLHGFEDGFPEVRVGNTSIRIVPSSHDPLSPVDPAMVVIEPSQG